MSQMIERVADVLLNAGCGDSEECLAIAGLVIEAMREPTEAMCNAGDEMDTYPTFSATPSASAEIEVKWRAMISAALSQPLSKD